MGVLVMRFFYQLFCRHDWKVHCTTQFFKEAEWSHWKRVNRCMKCGKTVFIEAMDVPIDGGVEK